MSRLAVLGFDFGSGFGVFGSEVIVIVVTAAVVGDSSCLDHISASQSCSQPRRTLGVHYDWAILQVVIELQSYEPLPFLYVSSFCVFHWAIHT